MFNKITLLNIILIKVLKSSPHHFKRGFSKKKVNICGLLSNR